MATRGKLRVLFDADVLLSAAAPRSPASAPFILLQLTELTLLEGVCCPFVVEQVRWNLAKFLPKVPEIEDQFLRLKATLVEVRDPTARDLHPFRDLADEADLPVLVAALKSKCRYLVTRNARDYPDCADGLNIVGPGWLVRRIREQIARL